MTAVSDTADEEDIAAAILQVRKVLFELFVFV